MLKHKEGVPTVPVKIQFSFCTVNWHVCCSQFYQTTRVSPIDAHVTQGGWVCQIRDKPGCGSSESLALLQ